MSAETDNKRVEMPNVIPISTKAWAVFDSKGAVLFYTIGTEPEWVVGMFLTNKLQDWQYFLDCGYRCKQIDIHPTNLSDEPSAPAPSGYADVGEVIERLSDEEIMVAFYKAGPFTAPIRSKWKDGIDIDVPSQWLKTFTSAVIDAALAQSAGEKHG